MAGSGRAGSSKVSASALFRLRPGSLAAVALLIPLAVAGVADAGQGRGGGARGAGAAPPTARASAPKDFTGYWVAVVTEHWHLRMEMPPKGEFAMLPLTPAAREAANKWTAA